MPVIPGPPTSAPPTDGAWLGVDDLPCDVADVDPAQVLQVITFASESLNLLVGGRYPGVRTDKIWPGLDASCGCGANRARVLPGSSGASAPSRRCGTPTDRIQLSSPVREIVEVLVDGDVVDPSWYQVLDGRWLVGLDGQTWPRCQAFSSTDPEGSFSVEWSYGNAPPAGGVLSAGALSCELLIGFGFITSDEPCRLGPLITAVQRQGVSGSTSGLKPQDLFAAGVTGLPEVDLWIATINGAPGRAGGSFMDPARRRPRHRR